MRTIQQRPTFFVSFLIGQLVKKNLIPCRLTLYGENFLYLTFKYYSKNKLSIKTILAYQSGSPMGLINPLCTSRLNLYDDIEEFTVKLFSVQFSSGFFSRKALDLCFYMQKTEVFYLVWNSFYNFLCPQNLKK